MKNLKKLREKRHMTQKELATKLGVSQGTVARWEQEPNRYPAGEMIPRIADLLACDIKDFFYPKKLL